MKKKKIVKLCLVSLVLIACKNIETETNVVKSTFEEQTETMILESDLNPNLEINLVYHDVIESSFSIGLPEDWKVKKRNHDDNHTYFEISKNNNEVVMFIYNNQYVEEIHKEKLPNSVDELINEYDFESTNFLLIDELINETDNKVIGYVYQFEDDSSEKYYNYFVDLAGHNYVNIVQEKYESNIDTCLAVIYSIKDI